MSKNITVTFEDGTSHVYQGAPDTVTPEDITARAQKEFNKNVTALDGGNKTPTVTAPAKTQQTGGLSEAIVEPLLRMGTGFVAKPLGEVTALARMGINSLPGADYVDPQSLSDTMRNALTYEPRTAVGQSSANPINAITDLIGSGVGGVQNYLTGGMKDTPAKAGINEAIAQAANIGLTKYAPKIASGVSSVVKAPTPYVKNLANALTENGRMRIAENIVNKAAEGTDKSSIIRMLRNAPENTTAGQAAVGANNRTFSAADTFGRQIDPNVVGAMTDAQSQASMANLLKSGAAPTVESQLELNRLMKEAETRPVIENELNTALNAGNQANVTLSALEPKLAQAQTAAETGVQSVRDMQGAKVRANELSAQNPSMIEADGTRTIAPYNPNFKPNMENLLSKAEQLGQKGADVSLQQGEQARFIKNQIDSLDAHGLKPLKTNTIRAKVNEFAKSDEASADPKFKSVMQNIDNQLAQLNTHANGGVTAESLYHLKKTGIQSAIEMALKDDPNLTQATIGRYASKISPLIDNALDSASGGAWSPYLKKYGSAMDKVNSVKLSGEMRNLYENNPTEFERVANGENPDFVKKITGFEKLDEADPSAANTYRLEAKKLAEARRLKELSGEGGSAFSSIVGGNEILPTGPHILSHKVALYNALINAVKGKATPAVAKNISKIMQDPKLAAKVLRKGQIVDYRNSIRTNPQPVQLPINSSTMSNEEQRKALAQQLRSNQ